MGAGGVSCHVYGERQRETMGLYQVLRYIIKLYSFGFLVKLYLCRRFISYHCFCTSCGVLFASGLNGPVRPLFLCFPDHIQRDIFSGMNMPSNQARTGITAVLVAGAFAFPTRPVMAVSCPTYFDLSEVRQRSFLSGDLVPGPDPTRYPCEE